MRRKPVVIPDTAVLCPCGAETPFSQAKIRMNDQGISEWVCPACAERLQQEHNQLVEQGRRQVQSIQAQDRAIAATIRQLSSETPHIARLAAALIDRLGGTEVVAAAWASQIVRTMTDKPEGKTALDAFKQVASLLQDATAQLHQDRKAVELTQDELDFEMRRIVGVTQVQPEPPSALPQSEEAPCKTS